MNYEPEFLLAYVFGCVILWFIFGIISSSIGSSFWWGFCLGPIGILIAAVRINGNRPPVVIINNGPRKRVRIVRHEPAEIHPPPRQAVPPPINSAPYNGSKTGRFKKLA